MDFVEQITRKERRIGIIGPGLCRIASGDGSHALHPGVMGENAKLVADTRNLVQILNRNGHKLVRPDGH